MAELVVSLVLETITRLLIEEKKFLSGVSDEAEKLCQELQLMQAFLRDADVKQNDEARVKVCVSQCRDLAYEAENVLEDYAFKLSSRRRGSGISSGLKRFSCILNECIIRHNVGSEIKGLNARISDLTRRFQDYGIMKALTPGEGSSSAARQQQSRVQYSYVANDADVVGIEGDIQKMQDVLVNENFGVVSITGMGGCGKTTLARKVYNHPNVKRHFSSFAWICVSQQWKRRKILEEILVSLDPGVSFGIQHWTEDAIVERIVRFQEKNKCLVVLDDVWTDEVWKCIEPALSLNRKGNCKILITTRNEGVATHIGPNGYHHRPRQLNEAESLELLMKTAFGHTPDQKLEDIESLKMIGREMVKACGGLPLAVVVLGGILASKKNLIEWEAVPKGIQFQKSVGEVKDILALSYYELPYYLKPCFLYLSVLSEDERMDGDRLYNLWIAEGMVIAKDNREFNESIKEVARRYMGELVKRCMVMVEKQPQPISLQIPEKSPIFYLHDLMRDMCRKKAIEENFMKVLDYGSDAIELENSISNIPRIMINSLSPEKVCRSLRALGFRARRPTDLIVQIKQLGISKFMMLRSLIIEGVIDPVVETIKAGNKMADGVFKLPIGKLIHLRQLSLRYCELVMSPSSISNLEHLEILDLEGSTIMWTNKHEIKARRLRHLIFPEDIEIGIVPAQIICVSNDLEVIGGPFPNSRLRVKNLSQLTNVREIGHIYFKYHHKVNVVEDMLKCILNSRHLKEVGIMDGTQKLFMEERESVLVRELLSGNVQSVCLVGPLSPSTLPDYDPHFARNLTKLHLVDTRMGKDPMKILEMSPHLQELCLNHQAFCGEIMVCHSMRFTQLKILKLRDLWSLKTWIVEKGAMPNLFHLEIAGCYKLKAIPEELIFTALKELVITSMPEKFKMRNVFKFSHLSSILINTHADYST